MSRPLTVDMPPDSIEQFFKMINPALELKVTIAYMKHPNLDKLHLGCNATFEVFETAAHAREANPLMTVTGYAPRSQDIGPAVDPDFALGYFSLIGSSNIGFSLKFDSVKITQIHPEEGERLLAFFKNMYGIKIIFQDDRIGLLANDGKEERVTFSLPYPSPYLAGANK